MKGGDEDLAKEFRDKAYKEANNLLRKKKPRLFSCMSFVGNRILITKNCKILFIIWCTKALVIFECRSLSSSQSIASIHGAVLALAACVLSAPYDMPRCVIFDASNRSYFLSHPKQFFDVMSVGCPNMLRYWLVLLGRHRL